MENTEIKNSTTFIECDVIMLKKAKRDYNGKHITLLNLVERKLEYGQYNNDFHNADWAVQQDLYVLSNKNIKQGEFFFNVSNEWLGIGICKLLVDNEKKGYCIIDTPKNKNHKIYGDLKFLQQNTPNVYKKIIATTNRELKLPIPESLDMYPMSYSPKSLPNVSNEFVQKYIHEYNKGLPIKKVLVEFENTQSCSLYPEKCCGNPLDCTNEGECIALQELLVSKKNTITTKLAEKTPKKYDEDRLFNLLQDFLTIPENSIKEHIKLWIKENLKK